MCTEERRSSLLFFLKRKIRAAIYSETSQNRQIHREDYKNRKLAVAICIKDNNKYRLVDGYHRFIANKDRDFVDIIVLE